MGGSIRLGSHAKRVRLAKLAAQERVPLVMLLEGAGERATNALERYPHASNDMQALTQLSSLVPTVAVVMGACAGHGAREFDDLPKLILPNPRRPCDELIDPRELCNALLDGLRLAEGRAGGPLEPARHTGIRP